jgi:mono/diheme cytochrome c family protein
VPFLWTRLNRCPPDLPKETLLMRWLRTLCFLALSLSALRADRSAAAEPASPSFTKDVAPFLAAHCTKCHGGAKPKGGLALDKFADEAAALKDRGVWERVADNLRSGDMPPPARKRPAEKELDAVNAWLDAAVFKVDCNGPKDPGRVTIRRLNRVEYNNTIRDLIGVDFQPADDFPADDIGYGFDNIGDVLSLPPILLEKYLAAAEKIVDRAFANEEIRKRILVAVPDEKTNRFEAARKVFRAFGDRAYRRPIRQDELRRLMRFMEMATRDGESFETGIKLGLQAILVSPHFLFRIETDPTGKDATAPHPISEYELATRLSYFLWSTMPDEELFKEARDGTLRKNLDAQVRRMLQHPKARALVDNFAGQWLQTRNVKTMTPDPGLFPQFDEALRSAMQKETELFFENVMRGDRSVLEFLDADYTFLNERLAKHYGIAGVKGPEFRKVSLQGSARGGVLTQASILTITSNPTRTSPVKRGKWILENILGTPPPPPPPDVDQLKEGEEVELKGSLRQRMEQHRRDPNCATCHQRMDPIGFAFENFDAIGGWRNKDGKFIIDPSGTLPSGQTFQGPAELRTILKGKADLFARCLSEKMLTYALGRGTEPADRCSIEEIARALAKNDYRFSSLVLAVVRSDPFQMRRGQAVKGK